MENNSFVRIALFMLKFFMFPIMMIVYIMLCIEQPHKGFSWKEYINSIADAITQYWSE